MEGTNTDDIKLCDYPEGWEKAKQMLDFLPNEEAKEKFMISMAMSFLRF